MPIDVLQPVTREHCLAVLARLDAGERPPSEYGHGISYDLVHEGKRYPPKAVLGMAASLARGRHVATAEFRSGEQPGQTNETLRALGFEVAPRRQLRAGEVGLDASVLAALEARGARDDERPHEVVRARLDAFRRRFAPERLRVLEPAALLQELHGRGEGSDSLVYWLEFKSDEVFSTRWFGSIAGGSALKFGVYKAAESGEWKVGSAMAQRVITASEAADVAVRQRAELLAGLDVVAALPDDLDAPAWRGLAATMAEVAPEFGHLAFFHKVLALWMPERIDDFHAPEWQSHALTSLGLVPVPDNLWANARLMIGALRAWRTHRDADVPTSSFTSMLSAVFGDPVQHWRIGTSIGSTKLLPTFLDERCVAVGWPALGNLDGLLQGVGDGKQEHELKAALEIAYPGDTPQVRGKSARALRRFARVIAEGDRVYAADGQKILAVGVVEGPYQFVPGSPAPHRRPVRWLTTEPFSSPTTSGLQTTVWHFVRDLAPVAAANLHLMRAPAAPVRTSVSAPRAPSSRPLSPVAAQVERKGQVVLYGPPGTGKTFHALRAAEELVAHRAFGRAWPELSAEERDGVHGLGPSERRRIWVCTFHPAFGYEDFVEGLRARPVDGGLTFDPTPGLFRRMCELASAAPAHEPFVMVIDEFNRGDAPRIFGELLTLLELDKRGRVRVDLPLSGTPFTVPPNVRLIATMNTSDRSIALLDAALRRRFGFLELLPEASVLAGSAVEGIDLGALLDEINRRLVDVLGSRARDLQVGHAYLMRDGAPIAAARHLRDAFRYDLLPLLHEYCADDPDALQRLVGDELYDRAAMRVRPGPFETGAEGQFIDAIQRWAPERLGAVAAPKDVEDDLDAEA